MLLIIGFFDIKFYLTNVAWYLTKKNDNDEQ
jgi:hypothetical protein